jgi:hypothetical protein
MRNWAKSALSHNNQLQGFEDCSSEFKWYLHLELCIWNGRSCEPTRYPAALLDLPGTKTGWRNVDMASVQTCVMNDVHM